MLFWITSLTVTLPFTSQQQMTACSSADLLPHTPAPGHNRKNPSTTRYVSSFGDTTHFRTCPSAHCPVRLPQSALQAQRESLQNTHHPLLAPCSAVPFILLWAKVPVTTWTVNTAVSRSFLALNKGHTWTTKHTPSCQCVCRKRSLF